MTFPFEFHLTPEQREREGVERRELSSVFQVYAQRLAARTLATGWRAHASLLEPPRADWLWLARRFLRSLRERGRSCVGTALLRALMERERVVDDAVTPLDPVELMSTAVRIWPSPETYLGLGQLLLAGERVDEAREVYAYLMRTMNLDEDAEFGWRVREGLGLAWEARGQRRLALGCLEKSALRSNAGIGPLVAAWPLAVELGRIERARWLADALDGRVRRGSLRLVRCLDGLAARRELGERYEWLPPARMAPEVRRTLAADGATAALCRSLLAPGVS